jgi:hypothetical protein
MALELTKTAFGVTFPTAYAKISGFSGSKDNYTINVDYFATEEARLANSPILASESYQWNTADADELVAEMYGFLKTLEHFENATDV